MGNDFSNRMLGVIMIFVGAGVIKNPVYYSPKYTRVIDHTGYNIPFGILLVVSGLVFFFSTFFKSKK